MKVKDLFAIAQQCAFDHEPAFILSAADLAALLWYAESRGVRRISDRHTVLMQRGRAKAQGMRYHNQAELVLPDTDELYDSAYGDAPEMGDWSICDGGSNV